MTNPHVESTPTGEILQSHVDSEHQARLDEVRQLDPELLEFSEQTRHLVESGFSHIDTVTSMYGTIDNPRWASGSYEQDVYTSYHCGGNEGHTSIGSAGAGVPRNVLLIAKAVNDAAGNPVYGPLSRAIAFHAACAHDLHQLHGRSLLPEGQGDGHGDERLSAETAHDLHLAEGGNDDTADRIYDGVMATAYNPETHTQNLSGRHHYTNDTDYVRARLNQELVACADLLSHASKQGPLGALAYCIEQLSTKAQDTILQKRLTAYNLTRHDVGNLSSVLGFIGVDEPLLKAFKDLVAGQPAYFSRESAYSDEMIRMVSGHGIDELFPHRARNAEIMQEFSDRLEQGESPQTVWSSALIVANVGY